MFTLLCKGKSIQVLVQENASMKEKKILTGINLTLLFGVMVVLVLVFSSFIQNNFSSRTVVVLILASFSFDQNSFCPTVCI